ncbi:hypothetical protein ABID22_003527 [Pontibacter aydingkolensis]|uniref:DUF4834 family protein n=1 Tax=Pontibacter aydingkolensis TaxID=1911536 RepID=A0ABS7CZ92_9BACT|nr:DUF4834 family protein [Pontibacter aydingkolensis]MBW7468837.1 DUF4834 family protein [Pontibacter aydingkolensis]
MIKFIFVTLLIIFFIRLVAPFLFRFLIGLFLKKSLRNGTFFYSNMKQQQQAYQDFHRNNSQDKGRTKDGVKIDYVPDQKDRKDFEGGQYVDYEEVK